MNKKKGTVQMDTKDSCCLVLENVSILLFIAGYKQKTYFYTFHQSKKGIPFKQQSYDQLQFC